MDFIAIDHETGDFHIVNSKEDAHTEINAMINYGTDIENISIYSVKKLELKEVEKIETHVEIYDKFNDKL